MSSKVAIDPTFPLDPDLGPYLLLCPFLLSQRICAFYLLQEPHAD
jgi:hypothetical protein